MKQGTMCLDVTAVEFDTLRKNTDAVSCLLLAASTHTPIDLNSHLLFSLELASSSTAPWWGLYSLNHEIF